MIIRVPLLEKAPVAAVFLDGIFGRFLGAKGLDVAFAAVRLKRSCIFRSYLITV